MLGMKGKYLVVARENVKLSCEIPNELSSKTKKGGLNSFVIISYKMATPCERIYLIV